MTRSTCELSTDDRDDFYVVTVKGSMTAMHVGTVRKAGECGINMGRHNLVFDLALATEIDSTGVALLATLTKMAMERGARFSIVGMGKAVAAAVERTGLTRVLTVMPTLEQLKASMGREISKEERGFYVLIRIPAEFSLPLVQPLRKAIDDSVSAGYKDFVFDLSETELVTSVGIGVLANLQKKLVDKGGAVHLVGVTDTVKRLLDATNILKVINSYDTLAQVEGEFL